MSKPKLLSLVPTPILILGVGTSVLFCLAVGIVYGSPPPIVAQVVGADQMIESAKETGRWEPVALVVIVIAIVTLFVAVITYLIRDASKREGLLNSRLEANRVAVAEQLKQRLEFEHKLVDVLADNAKAFGEAREASRAVVASSNELTRRLEMFTSSRPCLGWHLIDGKWIPRDDFVSITGNA